MNNWLEVSPRVGWRYIDDEIVVFNCANQIIAIWNETASQLWEILWDGVSSDKLVDWLVDEYSVDKSTATHDVLVFLQEAASMGLIDYDGDTNEKLGGQREINTNDGENVLLAIEMKAIEKLIPFAVTFEVTSACNQKCIHCYMEQDFSIMELSKIKCILDELAAEDCLFVSFTGGEFFTRHDALEIVDYASKLHFVIDILSNGELIREGIAETLANYSVRRVQISLYGASSETHDSVTCVPRSFQNTLNGIQFLKKAGIKVEIAFPLMRVNFNERYLVKELAESTGCVISPSHMITARNNGAKDTLVLRLEEKQLIDFFGDKSLSGLYAGRQPFQDHQFYLGFSDLLNAAPCYSGFNSCAITPSGKVLPCNQLLFEVGDLKMNTFSEVWHNSLQLKYLRSLTLRNLEKCSVCELLANCARCPGLAFLEGGDLLGTSPENCRMAAVNKLR